MTPTERKRRQRAADLAAQTQAADWLSTLPDADLAALIIELQAETIRRTPLKVT